MSSTPNTPIRIGILIGNIENLVNYELKIIEYIFSDKDLELALLIQDGRTNINDIKSKFFRNVFTKSAIPNIIFKIQGIVESKLFPAKQTVNNRLQIIEKLRSIKTIKLTPVRKGFLDLFSDEESAQVQAYNLDLILRHEFNIIRGKILNSAKYGIWSFHHGDNAINRGGPPGFWEITLNEPCVGVTLQQLTPALDGGNVIDKAYYNWEFSHVATNNIVLDSSVELLKKNIQKLKLGKVTYRKSLVYYNPLYKRPNLKFLFLYICKFYGIILSKILYKILAKITFKRRLVWHLFFSKGTFLETQLFRKKEIVIPKNEFWADPFLLKHNNETYAFFENFEYKKWRGKITCGKVVDNTLVDVKDALVLPYHMSYPFMLQQGNDIFMIPETQENNRVEIYKCAEFPQEWDLYATAFDNEQIVDTTFFTDDNNDSWLFLNRGCNIYKTELYIYKVDSLQLKTIIPHALNPVKIDTKNARNGGAIFKYEGAYYRPSQVNTHGKYGNGLNINKIIKLTLDEYEEETLVTVEPNFKKGLVGIHHLHQLDDCYIFDGCFKLK
jgi:hypothetical protein